MLIFATSDKGGTGRSVTGCNLAYRCALQGKDVCYLDFDFGSPTAGAIFEILSIATGTKHGGLHSLIRGDVADPIRLDVWTESDRESLRSRPAGAGQLVLFPGDQGGGEFPTSPEVVRRCAELFQLVEEEFEICFVDLSAGRSHATDVALKVTSLPQLQNTVARWMVFHRWTRQHIVAASDLVFGERGLVEIGVEHGHDEDALRDSIRFVRAAVLDLNSPELSRIRPTQSAWLQSCDQDLHKLADRRQLGRISSLGETPMDPILQWREQLISDSDVEISKIANAETVGAFDHLARQLTTDVTWKGL